LLTGNHFCRCGPLSGSKTICFFSSSVHGFPKNAVFLGPRQKRSTLDTRNTAWYLFGVRKELKCGKSLAHMTRDPGVAQRTLQHWYKELATASEHAFPGRRNPLASSGGTALLTMNSAKAAFSWQRMLLEPGIVVSMSRVGDGDDYAAMERCMWILPWQEGREAIFA
jgi:hypothetical protein